MPKKKTDTPKPDGTAVLTIRTVYTPEQIEARREDIASIEKQIASARATLALLKSQDRRKASAATVRARVDLETMVVTNADTGEQIHPSRLSSLQWKKIIEAAKASA